MGNRIKNFHGAEVFYNRDRFNPYGFLNDDYFEHGIVTYRIAEDLKEFPPHELYQDFKEIAPEGCGEKKSAKIIKIIETYRAANPKHFCECGEPYLHWYKFCPECGKERKA